MTESTRQRLTSAFFSSRRRHTRFDCDWSSDVCSSDLARGLATSPTYALVHQYRTPEDRVVYHVDCYRLRSPAEAQDLGFDDMVRDGAIVLIEWPERAGPWTPPLDRHFRLSYGADADTRELEAIR